MSHNHQYRCTNNIMLDGFETLSNIHKLLIWHISQTCISVGIISVVYSYNASRQFAVKFFGCVECAIILAVWIMDSVILGCVVGAWEEGGGRGKFLLASVS